jgi:hypothetical protein
MKTWKTKKVDGAKGVSLREIDRDRYPLPQSAFGADVTLDDDKKAIAVEIPEERFMAFDKPGKRIAAKRLYTVKGEKPDGSVTQIPLEGQINNNLAAPDMFIGLQFYTRKGFNVFFDLETGVGAFCPTWDCWAEWNKDINGFCSEAHRNITKPEKAEGPFEAQSTTSAIWG